MYRVIVVSIQQAPKIVFSFICSRTRST